MFKHKPYKKSDSITHDYLHACLKDFSSNPSGLGLFDASSSKQEQCCSYSRNSKNQVNQACSIEFLQCKLEKNYSFFDYIRGGTELACTIAIDFISSNGDPSKPYSLHFIKRNGKQDYLTIPSKQKKVLDWCIMVWCDSNACLTVNNC